MGGRDSCVTVQDTRRWILVELPRRADRRVSFYRLGALEEASVSMAGDRAYIEERVRHESDTGCWVWTSSLSLDGYGKYGKRGPHRNRNAHCVAYEVWVGPIPEGMQLDHLCRNRACVNPAHLDPVTHLENVRRAWGSREPKTHCVRGHEFTPENTYELKYTPGRQCRTCHREDTRRYRELKRNGALEERPGVDGHGLSSSASIPADPLETPGQDGALTLFEQPLGAYDRG